MTDSSTMRKDILTSRNQLPQEQLTTHSLAILRNILNLEQIKNNQSFFAYVSFRSEVETYTLIQALLKMGKTVSVPITRVQEKRLDAIRITDPEADLEPGYCAIPEPKETLCKTQQMQPSEIDVIFLPGSVFDERGGRFGYGGGYYDRFLSANPKAIRIGLAFEMQIVPEAPLQAHDEILDMVITEKRIIEGKR
jgi:5-formyltetrahydrofolate cyclo-ligase